MTLTKDYTYAQGLQSSLEHAWTVDDCFRGRDFDFSKSFLPDRIAGVKNISCLNEHEKRTLNQIRGNSYCHIFAFVEEYIVPMVIDRARDDVYGDETRLWALLRFAEEEVKHQEMLRRACDQFEAGFGVACGLIPGREDVADVVVASTPLTALLLTSLIEWFTQLHYVEHVQADDELDELFRDLLRFHWVDEARHARLDSLLIEEVARGLTIQQREQAIDELLQLGSAIDGLLQQQIELDVATLERAVVRSFSDGEKTEIRDEQRRAYRWTFLVSGLKHPQFVRIVDELAATGGTTIAAAAESLT